MILRWRDVHDQPRGIDLHDAVELPNLVRENRQVIAMSPVTVDLHAQLVSDTLTVDGKLQAQVTYRCSRCLTDYQDELQTDFSERFVRADPADLADEDERIPALGDQIELDPYLEQEILLAMPYTPLCSEECAGLCPVCGANRNEHVCECRTERIDPRLADLAKLLEQE